MILKISLQKSQSIFDGVLKIFHKQLKNYFPLRWSINSIKGRQAIVEATITNVSVQYPFVLTLNETKTTSTHYGLVHIVPTGIGASIGGFAGDAAPANQLLATVSDVMITHPNVYNASDFFNIPNSALYVEGFMIDQLMLGNIGFAPVRNNKIGLLIEKVDKQGLALVENIVNAMQAVHGINVAAIEVMSESIGAIIERTPSGTMVGTIKNVEGLLKNAEKLLKAGTDAIAVTSIIHGIDANLYQKHLRGKWPNLIGGVEAIISHLIGYCFGVPCGHAPLLNYKPVGYSVVDSRSAGEYVSQSGLVCVLKGLSKAPRIIFTQEKYSSVVTRNDVQAVVCPETSCGGIPVLIANKLHIPIITVTNNTTVLDVTPDKLNVSKSNIYRARNYLEAAGILGALKEGLSIDSINGNNKNKKHVL